MNNDVPSGEPSSQQDPQTFRLPLWLKVTILAVVVAMAAGGYVVSQMATRKQLQEGHVEPDDAEEIAHRKPVQDFILTESGGGTKKLSDFRGNVVILTFWASWCGPCLAELPTFAEIERKYRDKGLRIIPVNVDDGNEGRNFVKDFWPKKKIDFVTYYDVRKDLANLFAVDMLPSNFIIDRNGKLVLESSGASDWASSDMQGIIASVLAEPK